MKLVKTFDHEAGRMVEMPASEVEGAGMVNVSVEGIDGGVWVRGSMFDFREGKGPEPVADLLGPLVGSLSRFWEVVDYSLGIPRWMFIAFRSAATADDFVESVGSPAWLERRDEPDGEGGVWHRVLFPRERLPELYLWRERFDEEFPPDPLPPPLPEVL